MLIRKRYILVAIGVISVLLGSLFYSVVISAPGGEYDPWLDYNEDGIVDVNDLHSLGQVYSSSGDPTKNVNVMNWPISHGVTLWYGEELTGYVSLWEPTPYGNVSGHGRLHILVRTSGLDALEALHFTVYGIIWNADHTKGVFVEVYYVGMHSANEEDVITLDVPSECFRFHVHVPAETSCTLWVSYYLTWS